MKKMLLLFLTLVSIQSFSQEVSKSYDKIGKFYRGVAVVWKGGHCGLIQQSGKEIVPPEYDRIGNFGADAIAETIKNGKTGLISMEGKVIAPNVYESISGFHGFYAVTKKDGLVGMINKKGKVVVQNEYERITIGRHGEIRAVKNGQEVMLDVKD
jgi:hypothetical protein